MNRQRILVVDDDDDVRDALIDELSVDYDVLGVESGSAALERLSQGRFDAIISDLRMPGIDGVETLDLARKADPEIVRILLTGHLDEQAREATARPGAPFKVGKPWRDEIDVTLRRAFEFREESRMLTRAVMDALDVVSIDNELGSTEGLNGLGRVLCSHLESVTCVDDVAVYVRIDGNPRIIAGSESAFDEVAIDEDGWRINEPLSPDGDVRIVATGSGSTCYDIMSAVVARAQAWFNEGAASTLARRASTDPLAKTRLAALTRRAAIGTMTASLVHDLAGMLQNVRCVVDGIEMITEDLGIKDPDLVQSVQDVAQISERMENVFSAMSHFLRSGQLSRQVVPASELVQHAVVLCDGYIRARAKLEVNVATEAEVRASTPMLLQVLVNLLRNAADISPRTGIINLDVGDDGNNVTFTITDDGPGVPEDIRETMFDPFVSTKPEGDSCGLGLAIAAEIIAEHGGQLRYRRAADRGACFAVTLPKAAESMLSSSANATLDSRAASVA